MRLPRVAVLLSYHQVSRPLRSIRHRTPSTEGVFIDRTYTVLFATFYAQASRGR